MRRLAVLVFACALLTLSIGCAVTTITEEKNIDEDDAMSKQRQIREATEKALGGPIPDDEQRGGPSRRRP